MSSTEWKSSPLGKIPVDWTVEKGESLADRITKGASPNWQGFRYADEGVLFVTSENVRDGFLDVSSPKFVEAAFNEKQKNSILVRGDILINLVGASIGRSCRFDTSLPYTANVNQAVCVFRPNGTANADYLKHFLQAPSTIGRLIGSQADGARPNVSLTDIKTFHFLLPPTLEQQEIAAILSTWDRAIELTEKLIAAKQKRKQALMQQLLTGKVRLPQFGSSKHWTTTMLGDVVSLSSGGTPSKANSDYWNGKVPWVTAKDLKRLFLTDSIDHVSEEGIGNGTRLMPSGTVFVLVRGMTLLKDVPVCIATVPMCFNQDVRALTIRDEYDFRFIAYSLIASKHRLLSLVNVAGHGTGRLATEFLVEFPIKVPPTTEEQTSVADVIEATDKEMTLLSRRVEKLRSQKKGLMQQLLTGKVRVNVDAEMVKG